MTTQAHILVPIDGSEAAKRAVGYGAALAEKLGARLSFAHVQPASGSIVELKATDQEGRAMLAALADAYPHVRAPMSLVIGDDIACALCDSFPDAIVVVGSAHASSRAEAGPSIAEALVRRAHEHPILVVGPRVHTSSFDGPVTIALDGSANAEKSVLPGLAWARAFGSRIHLVQVVSNKSHPPDGAANDYLTSVRDLIQMAGPVTECHVVIDDDPLAGLVRHLTEKRCSLVFAATHSRDSIERAALGSVTMGLIAESPCTVCAIHPDAPLPLALTAGGAAVHAQLVPTKPT